MTKDEAAIEALICTELANPEQYLALSVTLPFKKCLNRKSMKTLRKALKTIDHSEFNARLNVLVQEHRIVAAAALRRTAQISEWFSAARELDVKCHTTRYPELPTGRATGPGLELCRRGRQDLQILLYEILRDKVTYENFDLLGPVKVDPSYFVGSEPISVFTEITPQPWGLRTRPTVHMLVLYVICRMLRRQWDWRSIQSSLAETISISVTRELSSDS